MEKKSQHEKEVRCHVEFDDEWDKEIIITTMDNIDKKYTFVQTLYDKAWEKIIHFDKLRQQHLNYALVIFSGLLVLITNFKNIQMQYIGCFGIILIMLIFCLNDHRLHRFTHGYTSTIIIFAQIMAYLNEDPKGEIKLYQYYRHKEKHAKFWKSRYTIIYLSLALFGLVAFVGFLLKLIKN